MNTFYKIVIIINLIGLIWIINKIGQLAAVTSQFAEVTTQVIENNNNLWDVQFELNEKIINQLKLNNGGQ